MTYLEKCRKRYIADQTRNVKNNLSSVDFDVKGYVYNQGIKLVIWTVGFAIRGSFE